MKGRLALLAASVPISTDIADALRATLSLCQRTLSFIFTVPIVVGCLVVFVVGTVGVVVNEVIVEIIHPRSLHAG